MNNDIIEGTIIKNCHIDGKLILKHTYVITVYNPKTTSDLKGLFVYNKEGELLGKTDTGFLKNLNY